MKTILLLPASYQYFGLIFGLAISLMFVLPVRSGDVEAKIEVNGNVQRLGKSELMITLHLRNQAAKPVRLCILDNWMPVLLSSARDCRAGGLVRDATRGARITDFPYLEVGGSVDFKFPLNVEVDEDELKFHMADRFGGVWVGSVRRGEKLWLCLTQLDCFGGFIFDSGTTALDIDPKSLEMDSGPTPWVQVNIVAPKLN